MKMINCSIPWVGMMPAGWRTIKIKQIADPSVECSYIDGDWIESPYITDHGIRYLTTGNIGDGKFKEQGNSYISEETFKELNCKYAYPGDLVISRLNAPYGRSCILPDTFDHFVLAVDNVILRPKAEFDKRYICYITQCAGFQSSVLDEAKGTTMKRISRTNLGNLAIPAPGQKDQIEISDFLDVKCAEIDSVLSRTRASIEEYKKLKQAVITQAVTKGIRGKRPMKDSGVEWIGSIPAEWKVRKGKSLFRETNERSQTGKEELLTVSHITGITPRNQKNVNMFMSESLMDYKICHVNDIAANTMWMWQGAIGVSKFHGVISPSYNTYRQITVEYDSEYLDYMLRTKSLVDTYNAYSTGITASRLRLYPQQFLSIYFPIPPMVEQKEIAYYLDRTCSEIDTLIAKKEQYLIELENYKKSLIYEYVTGKKEVPNHGV